MIYIWSIDGNFVPPATIDGEQEARKRIETFIGQRSRFVLFGAPPATEDREPDTIYPASYDEFLFKLRPGDVVIGNMNVITASKVADRGARLMCHDPGGKLIEYEAREIGPTHVINKPWNATGQIKMPRR